MFSNDEDLILQTTLFSLVSAEEPISIINVTKVNAKLKQEKKSQNL